MTLGQDARVKPGHDQPFGIQQEVVAGLDPAIPARVAACGP